jgi:YD repeat-containing protein
VIPTGANDPILIHGTTPDGVKIEVVGERTNAGQPAVATAFTVSDAKGAVTFRYDSTGRLTGFSDDQTSYALKYEGAKIYTEVRLATGEVTHVEFDASTIAAVRESPMTAAQTVAAANIPRTGRLATIQTSECGQPADAQVDVQIFTGASGVVTRTIPAYPVGNGVYQALVPVSETSLNVDIRAQDTLTNLRNVFRPLCESSTPNRQAVMTICSALAIAASVPGMQAFIAPAAVCLARYSLMTLACSVLQSDRVSDWVINAAPETIPVYRPDLYVRARWMAWPTSRLSGVYAFNGPASYSFDMKGKANCPTLKLMNRSSAGSFERAVGGVGTVYIPPMSLAYYLNGRPIATVAPGRTVDVKLTDYRNGDRLIARGGSVFIRTYYDPVGQYNGWCPSASLSGPAIFTPSISRNTSSKAIFVAGNPICQSGNPGTSFDLGSIHPVAE